MRKAIFSILLLAAVFASVPDAPTAQARVPDRFFGISPQTALSGADTSRMGRGGFGSVRIPLAWSLIQPRPRGGYSWSAVDQVVRVTARRRLEVLPFLYSTPRWLARPTTLPVQSARQRRAWSSFLRAAAERYGPGGAFWQRNPSLPGIPIRKWQIWNEANFFYFARPASPALYARLLKISDRALHRAAPTAKVIASGLFASPRQRPPAAMDANAFLQRLYRIPGSRRHFDAVSLHPYSVTATELMRSVRSFRRVVVRNGDRRTKLLLTEIGWGSDASSNVSFEIGRRGQARELRRSYRLLIKSRRALNLEQTFWFTWKDVNGSCAFCDSSGLFERGQRFRPKPAWFAFKRITRAYGRN